MTIQIYLTNTETKKKRLWGTIKNNTILEAYLNFKYGQLEHGVNKSLKIKDIYTMAGFAIIYLMNNKEPKLDRSQKVVNNQTLLEINKVREMRNYASICLKISFNILSTLTPNEKVSFKLL
jgi:hypothetical protein